MTGTQPTETDQVDPGVAFEGFASLKNHDGNPVRAVQSAYNRAVRNVTDAGREPVMIRVIVHVAQKPVSLDDETPLSCGYSGDTSACESCQ